MRRWYDLQGFWADYYQVCRSGRVRNKRTKRILAERPQHDGYIKVHLHATAGGVVHDAYPRLHRLVAEAFCGRPANTTEVDHVNGIRSDNRVCNLRWVTRQENQLAIKQRKQRKERQRKAS
ncbi:MAG: HNH endonuclease [Coriobacteriales bacterium]|jgi:hypothetical protein|nr:HNH endonuclease [Coriobacteriales bacterium]